METLQINKANAVKAYNAAKKETKELLISLFGEETFVPKNIMERIKTFEDALAVCPPSDNVKTLLQYNGIDKQMISSQAHAKLSIIAKALNEGWVPDFGNSNETKYYPWFEYTPGVGFSYDGYVGVIVYSGVGSRLCFKTRELAEYAGKQFQSIYNDFLN